MANTQLIATDIVIKQNQNTPSCGTALPCSDHDPPKWSYILPTPAMIDRGLTADILKGIINDINNISNQNYTENFNKQYGYLWIISCIGVFIGIIICISTMGNSGLFVIGMIIFGISGFLTVVGYGTIMHFATKSRKTAMETVKRYVEVTLNEKYQRVNGIRWSIIEQQTIHTSGSGNDRRIHTFAWYNIGVTVLMNVIPNNNNDNNQVIIIQPVQQNDNGNNNTTDIDEAKPFVPKQYSEGDNAGNNEGIFTNR